MNKDFLILFIAKRHGFAQSYCLVFMLSSSRLKIQIACVFDIEISFAFRIIGRS